MEPLVDEGTARERSRRSSYAGGRVLSRGFVCVGGKVKKIFWGKALKTWRIAVKALNNRRIFQPVAQLMYALSRVNCAFRACGREGLAYAARAS